MAKKRRKNRSKKRTYSTRVYSRPNRRLRSVPVRISKSVNPRRGNYYYASQSKPKYSTTQTTTVTVNSNAKNNTKKPKAHHYAARIQNPLQNKALICARRAQRKEILHALKHTGKSGQKRPTRNKYRNINCKG